MEFCFFLLKKERYCFTSPSLELTYASVFTLTELRGLDWGVVHLDIPKAHFECSPRRTKPARHCRNPEDFARSQWAQVWNQTKDGSETKVNILYPHLYCLDNCISDCWDVRRKLCPENWTSATEARSVYSSYDFDSNPINLSDSSPPTAGQSSLLLLLFPLIKLQIIPHILMGLLKPSRYLL